MIVYQTRNDGSYVGPVEADESPLEPGVWIIPGGCVEVAPPEIPEGMMAVWQGDQWSLFAVPSDDQPPPPPVTVPGAITFVQLLIGLVAKQWITEAEGEAWANGAMPAGLLALIGQMPEEHRFPAKMRALRATTVPRQDPLVIMMATALGKEDDLDAFFTTYGAI